MAFGSGTSRSTAPWIRTSPTSAAIGAPEGDWRLARDADADEGACCGFLGQALLDGADAAESAAGATSKHEKGERNS